MTKVLLALAPLVGTIVGSYLGITKNSFNNDNREHFLMAVATGILGAILLGLLDEATQLILTPFLYIGIVLGILFIIGMNKIVQTEETHAKLFWAMTIHNIPEGIVIGMALAGDIDTQAIGIVVSITLQNIPDGLVVSMSSSAKNGKKKAFWLGVLSGIVEPFATALIVLIVSNSGIHQAIEPIFIGFSVAAIFTIESDLLRNCKKDKFLWISFLLTYLFSRIV